MLAPFVLLVSLTPTMLSPRTIGLVARLSVRVPLKIPLLKSDKLTLRSCSNPWRIVRGMKAYLPFQFHINKRCRIHWHLTLQWTNIHVSWSMTLARTKDSQIFQWWMAPLQDTDFMRGPLSRPAMASTLVPFSCSTTNLAIIYHWSIGDVCNPLFGSFSAM